MTRLIIALLLCAPLCTRAATYYAATNGLPSNTGAIGSAWDLRTALNKTATLAGGDTIFMRGGAYTNAPEGSVPGSLEGHIFQANVSGAYGNPIVIQSYPGEWAILDGKSFGGVAYQYHASARPTLMVGSSAANSTTGWYITWRNFEVMSSSTESRFTTNDSSFPDGAITRIDGFYVYGRSNVIQNVIVHDACSGFLLWEQCSDVTLQNCVAYNNGWQSTHAHGHGIYTQNISTGGLKIIDGNLLLNNFDNSAQAYGSGTAQVFHYRFLRNIMLNNRLLVGGRTDSAEGDNVVDGNWQYKSDLVFIYQTSTNAQGVSIINNYVAAGALQGGSWTNATITNNTVVNTTGGNTFDLIPLTGTSVPTGWTVDNNHYLASSSGGNYFRIEGLAPKNFTQWKSATGWDSSSTLSPTLPTTNLVVLQANTTDTNRAHLAVYNWATASSVAVNLASLGWSQSDSVRVRNGQDYFSDVTTNTIPDNVLTVPMLASQHTVALPNGSATVSGPMSFPTFGAFVLERIAGAPATPTNTISFASSNPSSGAGMTVPNDLNGNSAGNTAFSRDYLLGTVLAISASPTAGGNNFSKWQRNGIDYVFMTNISYTVDTNVTLTAVYAAPPVMIWTFNMASTNPASGVVVTNSPLDNSGNGTGTTAFSRTYNDGAVVTISAPATASGNNFQKWQRGGVDLTTMRSFSITANSASLLVTPQTFTAVYVTPAGPTQDLLVNSVDPASVSIVVSVTDTNGNKNGTTSFTRTYPQGAVVTLSAPPVEPSGNVFVDWQDSVGNSASAGSTNVAVTLDISRTRVAIYTNPPPRSLNLSGARSRRRGLHQ